ncbi:MAG: TonB-dependent receptor [Woeseiaceae bacterium]
MTDRSLNRGRHWICAVSGALLALPSIASAQLEEIVVTAERREASIQDVPVAVSAYNEALLEKLQIQETLDLVNVVPNLFGGNNTGLGTANMYYLRAQGNDESIATFDPPVGSYIDDVYVSRQNANNFAFFDVDRIEVLRGPQGTLFGRNTTGGAVNIVLRKPSAEGGGFIEAAYGRFNEYMLRGTVDLPVSETVLTKFSAYYVQNDGWLENTAVNDDFNDRDSKGFRAAVRFIPNDEFTWDLSVDFLDDTESSARGALQGDDRVTDTILPNGLPAAALSLINFQPQPVTQKAPGYGNFTESLSVISNMEMLIGEGTGNLILGYRNLEQKFLLNFPGGAPVSDDFFWIDNDGEHKQLTAEFKYNVSLMDDKLDLVTGVFVMDEDNSTNFADYLFGGSFLLADRILDNSTKGWALFAQGDFRVSEKGTVTLGLRYTDEKKEIALQDNTVFQALTTENLLAAGVPLAQEESIVTPRIAYTYDFNDDVMAYVSATRGFKGGGWNARGTSAVSFQPFGPETLWSYEAGMRGDFWDDKLRLNATLFSTDLEDLQTTAATPTGAFLTTNAGGLDVTGLELEITYVPTDWWDIFLFAGFQDAKYTDLPAGCVTPNTSIAAFDVNCNVADPKRSPDTTVTLGTTLDFPMPAFGASLQPTASIRYIGENVTGTVQQGLNDPEVIVNAGVSLVDDDGIWSLTAECNNCSDEEYTTSFLFVPYFTEPMNWQVRFRYNFLGK